jgi:transposase
LGKPYPPEFRRQVVAAARERLVPLSHIALEFGISEATLYNWMKQADIAEPAPAPEPVTDERRALREALYRIRILEKENRILRRAAALLARDIPPSSFDG